MKEFIQKILDLGVTYSMACNDIDRESVRKQAEVLYKKHQEEVQSVST